MPRARPLDTRGRTILHVDMDAFYAAIEQRDRPELLGKPVIVGADPKAGRGRGVVSTASYEARRFGVFSAMPISVAYRLCPKGVYLRVDMDKYVAVSRQVMAVLRRFSNIVEPISIDEAFLDVSGSERAFGSGETIARQLRADVRAATSLTASVGVAASKLVAKVASDIRKPDALVVVPPGTESAFLAPLPIRRLWGVGPKLEEELAKLGVVTIGDLAALSDAKLARRLGVHGHDLKLLALGQDARPVAAEPGEAKSLGQEHTYDEDTADRETLRRTLRALCDSVGARLRDHDLKGRTLTLKYRDETFRTFTRSATVANSTDSSDVLFAVASRLFESVHGRLKVRLLGIYCSGFGAKQQLDLFAARPSAADQLKDSLARRFGDGALVRASLLPKPAHSHSLKGARKK